MVKLSQILFLYFACIQLSVSIEYLVFLYLSLHSYNEQLLHGWFVRPTIFHNSSRE